LVFLRKEIGEEGISEGMFWWRGDPEEGNICLLLIAMVSISSFQVNFIFLL